MDEIRSILIPVRIYSEANIRCHWAVKYKRKKAIQAAIRYHWKAAGFDAYEPPCDIKLTRMAPRRLDFDNLVHSLKNSQDVVADLLIPGLAPGRADDDPRLTFLHFQEKSKEYGLKIEVIPLDFAHAR